MTDGDTVDDSDVVVFFIFCGVIIATGTSDVFLFLFSSCSSSSLEEFWTSILFLVPLPQVFEFFSLSSMA